jgi:hypothetical protein
MTHAVAFGILMIALVTVAVSSPQAVPAPLSAVIRHDRSTERLSQLWPAGTTARGARRGELGGARIQAYRGQVAGESACAALAAAAPQPVVAREPRPAPGRQRRMARWTVNCPMAVYRGRKRRQAGVWPWTPATVAVACPRGPEPDVGGRRRRRMAPPLNLRPGSLLDRPLYHVAGPRSAVRQR